jgi:hypothetical protein
VNRLPGGQTKSLSYFLRGDQMSSSLQDLNLTCSTSLLQRAAQRLKIGISRGVNSQVRRELVGKVAGRKIEFRDSTPEAFELE